MTKNRKYYLSIGLAFIVFFITTKRTRGQYSENFKVDFVRKFDSVVSCKNNPNSSQNVTQVSKQGNSLTFMSLSDNLDAKNLMFEATGNVKYLQENYGVITNVLNAGKIKGDVNLTWISKSNLPQYRSTNDKEVILYEGYLWRYVTAFQYLIAQNSNNPQISKLKIPINYTENVFFKWYNRSIKEYGDDSQLQHIRIHIGSHWAIIAMYLYKLSSNTDYKIIYKKYFERYNEALRNNLKIDTIDGHPYYIWNSTYDNPFTNLQKKDRARQKRYRPIIQDVTHGNHVVQYVIISYELGLNDWTKHDIQLFANTLKYKIWQGRTKSFSDDIDGSRDLDKSLQNTGWKQSDGWMKLMLYDRSLYPLYITFYKSNEKVIDKTYLNLQFYADFAMYQKLYSE